MKLEIGQVVEARVERLEPYGVYLDYEGQTLLVLITETSWIPEVRDCRDFADVGMMFDVKILGRSTDGAYYGASIRQARPEDDPWRTPSEFAVGSGWTGMVTGRISMTGKPDDTFGYVVEIRPGVKGVIKTEGLIRWFAIGENVDVRIDGIDLQRNEVLLSLRPNDGASSEGTGVRLS
jgi:ribosomal protein S1